MSDYGRVYKEFRTWTANESLGLEEKLNNPPQAGFGQRYEVYQVLSRPDGYFTIIFKLRSV